MNKRFLRTSLLVVLALGSVSAHSFGDTTPPAPVCYTMDYALTSGNQPTRLSYDIDGGVTVSLHLDASPLHLDAHLPLTVGGDPNPHFDRLYALLMKGFDNERIAQVCVDHLPTSSLDRAQLVSLSLSFGDTRRVTVCDKFNPNNCASVSVGGDLFTRTVAP
jgi:hypothetical protein